MDITAQLRNLYCLNLLEEESLLRIAEVARKRVLFREEALFEEGEEVGYLYMVCSGSIKLFKVSPEGRELIIRVVNAGDLFGCESLFHEDRYLMSAVALEESEVIRMPAERFKEVFISESGPAGLRLLESLSTCIQQLVGLIDNLAFKDVELRILDKLYEFTSHAPLSDTVTLRLTHQDIASLVGTVREVVSRTMSKLKSKGVVVESTVRGFRVDRARLAELLEQRYSYMKTETAPKVYDRRYQC